MTTYRVIAFYRGSQIAQPPMTDAEFADYLAYLGADNRARNVRPEMICISEWRDDVFASAYVRDVLDIRREYGTEPIAELDLTEYPNPVERAA